MRPYLGASEQLVGTRSVQMSFTIEAAGSGTAGTAPAWGPVLRACGMAEVVVATKSVEYNPVSGGFSSATIYYSIDGVLYKALGCRGTFELAMGEGERPVFKVTMTGLDGGVAAAADPTVTLTAWKTPAVVTNQNSAGILLGCGYTAPAFTAGTAFASRGLQVTLGQDVQHVPMLGGETIEITGRETTGSMQPEPERRRSGDLHDRHQWQPAHQPGLYPRHHGGQQGLGLRAIGAATLTQGG